MKSHIKISIINIVVILIIGLFISYYGLFVGESDMSVYVAYAGALLIGHGFHMSWDISKFYRRIDDIEEQSDK